MIASMFSLMGEMLLLMLTGLVIRKAGIVTNEGKKCLSGLILDVVLPCNIFHAFVSIDFDQSMFLTLGTVLLIAILIQVLCTLIGAFAYNRMEDGEKQVYQYATVCSNAGFMGNPLSEAIFGEIGLLYTSIYLIPLRIVMWTAGVSYFSKDSDKKQLIRKVMANPCMIAVYFGFFFLLTGLGLPQFVSKTVSSLSSCTTALTMVYIGTILADVDWKTLVSGKQIYFALIRLIFIPLIVWIPCLLLHVDATVTGVSVFLAAMPAGSTTSLLASRYGADEETAAKCVVFTTALSVVTLPVWGMLLT